MKPPTTVGTPNARSTTKLDFSSRRAHSYFPEKAGAETSSVGPPQHATGTAGLSPRTHGGSVPQPAGRKFSAEVSVYPKPSQSRFSIHLVELRARQKRGAWKLRHDVIFPEHDHRQRERLLFPRAARRHRPATTKCARRASERRDAAAAILLPISDSSLQELQKGKQHHVACGKSTFLSCFEPGMP